MTRMFFGIATTCFSLLPAMAAYAQGCRNLTPATSAQELLDCIRGLDDRTAELEAQNAELERKVQNGEGLAGRIAELEAGNAWHPLSSPHNFGSLPRHADTVSFNLPPEVPPTAREVLVYVWLGSGESDGSAVAHYEIYTQQGETKYFQYILWFKYPQNAISFNSDNLWIPLTSSRQILVRLDGPIPNNIDVLSSEMRLLAWR
jgi:hypothetical protein